MPEPSRQSNIRTSKSQKAPPVAKKCPKSWGEWWSTIDFHVYSSLRFQTPPCSKGVTACGMHQAIRKESCWTISNITAGNREQIQEAQQHFFMDLFSREPFFTIHELIWLVFFFLCGGWYARISNPLRHNTFGAHSWGHQQWLAASCDLEGMERNGVKCDRARIVVTFTYFLYIIYFYILVTTMIMI